MKLHEPIIIFSVNRVHYNCVLISRNADAYLYIPCALILKYQILSLSRELICYFRLLSHRCINVGHIETHTLWNKARVLHIYLLVHTPRSSLASVMLCQSYGQLQRQSHMQRQPTQEILLLLLDNYLYHLNEAQKVLRLLLHHLQKSQEKALWIFIFN